MAKVELRTDLCATTVDDVRRRMVWRIVHRDSSTDIEDALLSDAIALCAAGKAETVVPYETFRAAAQQRDARPAKAARPRTRPADPGQGAFGF